MAFKVPEQYRNHDHPVLKSDWTAGNNGLFEFPSLTSRRILAVIASDGGKWEHVSVQSRSRSSSFTPTWDEMCFVKEMFWSDEDIVIQYHPAKSHYVNCHKNVLHLWRPVGQVIPLPPIEFV